MPFTPSADADMWWESTGNGEPVVLINGLGSPSATWFRLVDLLAPEFTVIRLDNRGTGRTVAPSVPHTVATMAADVAAVIESAGHSSAHVVGHSLGGLIAQELALEHPQVVRSLVLAATHVGIPHLAADGDPETAAVLVAAASLPPAERAVALRGLLYSSTTSEEAIVADEAVRAAHPTSADGFRDQLLGAAAWERLSDLHTLDVPTLVIHGTDDRTVPMRAGERLAAAIPGARFEAFTETGHALFTDSPIPVGQTITSFFSLQTAPAS